MKNLKIVIISIIALFITFIGGFGSGCLLKKDVVAKEVVDVEIKGKQDFGKPALIYFFAKNCSSCKKFNPTWAMLKKKYKKDFNFIELDVDLPANAPYCYEFMVNIIPAVHIEDAPFRNRAFINPMEYHFLPRFEDTLNRYLEMREILKKGAVESNG